MKKIITTAAAAALILDAVAIGYSRSEARITVTLPTEGAAPPTAAEEIITGVCTFGDCPVATTAQNLAVTSQNSGEPVSDIYTLTAYEPEEAPEPVEFPTEATNEPVWKDDSRTVTCWVTAYCGCESCSEGCGSMTATGRTARADHTVAVDPSVIPYFTQLEIDGTVYTAEDCGGGVNGYHVDIYFDSHAECEAFDTGYYTVTIY
jgi:3D (Asp-Asp-Asp) domain-containing protein